MAERNDAPVQQWLVVWERLRKAGEAKYDSLAILHLVTAVQQLYLLLEPASVREARRVDDAVLEFVEGDE